MSSTSWGIRSLALLALLFLTAAIAVQPPAQARDVAFQITGRVLDADNGRPLAGAQVLVEELNVGALSNADGRYLILVPEGAINSTELRVSAVMVGYATATQIVRPGEHVATGAASLDFRLRTTALRLDELVVSGSGDRAQARQPYPVSPAIASEAELQAASHIRTFVPGGLPNREQYARIEDNAFKSAADHPLSTFSVDVDRASYSNLRRFLLREHRLPPVDAVQVEEMVNYFPYQYDLPRGDAPVEVTTELGWAPWREGHQLLRVGLASTPMAIEDLPPANLVFLLDVSGSMQAPNKLPLVKQSLRLLVNQLREEDRVALAVYAGAAGLVLEPTSGTDKERILEAIERLEAGGSTAGGAGLQLAYDVARRHFVEGGNNRVILATDGDFNVGPSSDAAMTRLVESRREEGTFLTVLGFGTGNLQNTKMQEMAQNGNGNYAYIDGLDEARKVLVGELGGTLVTVAKDVKIQVEFNPERVRSYRLIGYENRLLAKEDFNDDAKDAGEMGAGHTVTALYEIVPVGSASDVGTPSVDPLRYGPPVERREETSGATGSSELAFVKVRYKEPTGSESRLLTRPVQAAPRRVPSVDLRFASAVAGFGMLLRESEHRGTIHSTQILELARSGLGEDREGYRRGFLDLVEAYRILTRETETDPGAVPHDEVNGTVR